jgi:tetratricopeptide (TPR) repeat protein/predicted Ser/Thr protein kinase
MGSDKANWQFGSVARDGSEDLRPPAVGDEIDSFRILSPLGEGAKGLVFRAHDRQTGRDVALKLMRNATDQRDRDRFLREGELTASLSHPGILKIHSVGEDSGLLYIVYELVEGETLESALKTRSRDELVRLVLAAARAMGYAHEHGVIHRDLKPSNILIDSAGQPKVADFGLAWSPTVKQLTQSGAMLGTPRYMSPEQFSGAGTAVGPPTDVWALGLILYRCLTGEPPFKASGLAELAGKIAKADVVSPAELVPDLSSAVVAVCLRALSKRPEDRYPDGQAFAIGLQHALASQPQHQTWQKRAPTQLAVAVAFVVLGAALALPSFEPLAPSAKPTPIPPALLTTAERLKEEVASVLERARQAREASRLADSADALLEAVKLDPNSAEAWKLLAIAQDDLRDGVSAAPSYRKALDLEPSDVDGWLRLGSRLSMNGDDEGALDVWRHAAKLAPRQAEPLSNQSVVLLNRGETTAALELCDEAIRRDPGSDGGWSNRALAKDSLGDPLGALEDLNKALELKQTRHSFTNRGTLRANSGDLRGAIRDYTRALELDDDARTFRLSGMVREKLGDRASALREYGRAIGLAPDDPESWFLRGDARRRHGDPLGARDDLREFLKLSPESSNAARARQLLQEGDPGSSVQPEPSRRSRPKGIPLTETTPLGREGQEGLAPGTPLARVRLLIARGLYDDALLALRPLLVADPDSLDALLERGIARSLRGDVEAGQRDFERVFATHPWEARALRTQGIVHARAGNVTRAIHLFNQSIRSDGQAGRSYVERGAARAGLGDSVGALLDLKKATEFSPRDPRAHFNRGFAHVELQQFPEAITSFRRALGLVPPSSRLAAAAREGIREAQGAQTGQQRDPR